MPTLISIVMRSLTVPMSSFGVGLIALALFALPTSGHAASAVAARVQVDAGFPGGNIILERIEGDNVYLNPDLRETAGKWFYWCFRVRGAGGRTMTFKFTAANPVGMRGPAVSMDGGLSWKWLGMDHATISSFSFTFPAGATEVLFSVGMTYTEQNLRSFIARTGRRPDFVVDTLGRSEHGRSVELLRVGHGGASPRHRVAITARHHACEMMASYVLEGIVEGILADNRTGQWLRENVAFLLVPFMDKDGVEEGLQGKNRLPHDPGRDYVGPSHYPNVAALKKLLPEWSGGKLRIALDLHCPALRGKNADRLHFVGGPVPEIWTRVGRFGDVLARGQAGPLVFNAEDNVPHGTSWNTLSEPKSFNLWAAQLPGISFSTTLEIPYADVRGREVNAETARALGHDLAAAIRQYLASEFPP
ncbi:MAG: M14 family zinc carboxypeptidase [Opitutaceae bacterium]|nr:M14 family zinc carboxypeptidase [Opitutaceae bacterium]